MRIAAIVLLVALSASADPVRTDPEPTITVFTDADGAHVVTLVEVKGPHTIYPYINQKENGKAHARNRQNATFGLGQKVYWVRTRFVDGRLICEKFSFRPKAEADVDARAAELFKESCS